MTEPTDTILDQQLADEYRINYARASAMTATGHSMRGWLVAGVAAFIALEAGKTPPVVLIVVLIASVWFSEGLNSAAQHRLHDRIEEIEAHFRGAKLLLPYQARDKAVRASPPLKKYRQALRSMFEVGCWPFYSIMIAVVVFSR